VFWFLDCYYLSLERIYRKVYKIYDESKGIDYRNYNLKASIYKSLWSLTVFPIYISEILLLIVLYLIGVEIL